MAEGSIRVIGTAVVEVTLQHGSGDDEEASPDSFPFEFDAELGYNLEVTSAEITADTSSFYE